MNFYLIVTPVTNGFKFTKFTSSRFAGFIMFVTSLTFGSRPLSQDLDKSFVTHHSKFQIVNNKVMKISIINSNMINLEFDLNRILLLAVGCFILNWGFGMKYVANLHNSICHCKYRKDHKKFKKILSN